MSSVWVVHSDCPDVGGLVSQCSGNCDNCEYEGHNDLTDFEKIIEEIKANGKKMSESKPPHKYYKAISVNKVLEIIQRNRRN